MTNKEIAEKLNVSPSALSIIINHKKGVSDTTRKKVISQLKDMGLDYLIKDVESPITPTISFIIYKRDGAILDRHPFFLLLMEHIESQAAKYGYSIMLSTIDKRNNVAMQIQRINQQNTKGAIIFATEMGPEDLNEFNSLSIPYVTLDNDFSYLPCNSVSINNIMGTYQAIEYLVSTGHSRIGYLCSSNRISSFDERYEGYCKAMKQFNRQFLPQDIWYSDYSEEGSYRDICAKINSGWSNEHPDAFVCDDDTIAIGAIRAFHEFGVSIPDDLSIIGFNDRPTCEVTTPKLTSIDVPKSTFAKEAVDLLVGVLNSDSNYTSNRSRKVRIGTRLAIRGSVSTSR